MHLLSKYFIRIKTPNFININKMSIKLQTVLANYKTFEVVEKNLLRRTLDNEMTVKISPKNVQFFLHRLCEENDIETYIEVYLTVRIIGRGVLEATAYLPRDSKYRTSNFGTTIFAKDNHRNIKFLFENSPYLEPNANNFVDAVV